MIITLLTNLYPPFVRGGADFLTHHLALELKAQGHEVCVVTSVPWRSVKGFKPQLEDEHGIRVYRFYPFNLYHYLSAARMPYVLRFLWQFINLFNLFAAGQVRRILQREQPDLTVSANLMGLSFLLPRTIAKLGLRHLHVLHDVQLLHPSGLFLWSPATAGRNPVLSPPGRGLVRGWGSTQDSLPMRAYQAATRLLFASVDTVVSPSAWLMREHTQRKFFTRARQEVLPNPVPPAQATPQLKTTKSPLKLVYVGQFEAHKGVLWLLQALQGYTRQDFELHLYALGQKPKLTMVRELAVHNARIKLHDIASQAEIDTAYAAAHLTLVPSLCYENSPLAIPVSFAAGTPVLAARIGGIPELIHEGETGWLFNPGDSADFLKKLTWCLDNPGKLLEAGLKGSRAFASRTLEHYARELLRLGGHN